MIEWFTLIGVWASRWMGAWLLAIVVMISLNPVAAIADSISGYWLTPTAANHGAIIRIQGEDGAYNGRIVALQHPHYPANADNGHAGQPRVDLHNPDPARRDDPLVGLELVRGFRPADTNHWEGARIYDPQNGKTYRCSATLVDHGRQLRVRGYIGIPMFGRTQEWQRVLSADYFKQQSAD